MQASATLLSAACLLAVMVLGAEAAPKQRTLPAYVKTCTRNDPKLNECALKNGKEILPKIMKGDSSIKLPPLEPLFLPQVAITTAGGARGGGLHLVCTNCNIHGLSGAQLNDVKLNLKKNHLDIKVLLPKLSIVGKYKVDGKLLLFPVYGAGDANLTLYDLDVTAGLDWKLIKKKGEEYARLSSHSVDFEASNFKLSLTGLFNGDKALNENMNTILNDNWKDILNDLKPSISDTVGQIMKLILNQIFDIVPFDQVIPPK